jgi:hypothetical protein
MTELTDATRFQTYLCLCAIYIYIYFLIIQNNVTGHTEVYTNNQCCALCILKCVRRDKGRKKLLRCPSYALLLMPDTFVKTSLVPQCKAHWRFTGSEYLAFSLLKRRPERYIFRKITVQLQFEGK